MFHAFSDILGVSLVVLDAFDKYYQNRRKHKAVDSRTLQVKEAKLERLGDILRLLRKNILDGKWLIIYVNEEQHLPYWKLVNKKGKFVIVYQTV